MNRTNRSNVAVERTNAATDAELLAELDALVRSAAEGDSRAAGAIAIAFGPMILGEARAALGEAHAQDDADVMHDFMVKLLEKRLRFPQVRGAAIPWMKRMVRLLAEEHVRELGPPPDGAAE